MTDIEQTLWAQSHGIACRKCGSSAQVWVNQRTNNWTCHKVGCHNNGGLEFPSVSPPANPSVAATTARVEGPSKEAEDAAEELCRIDPYGQNKDQTTARILDRHFAPLRSRVAELEQELAKAIHENASEREENATEVGSLTTENERLREALKGVLRVEQYRQMREDLWCPDAVREEISAAYLIARTVSSPSAKGPQ